MRDDGITGSRSGEKRDDNSCLVFVRNRIRDSGTNLVKRSLRDRSST